MGGLRYLIQLKGINNMITPSFMVTTSEKVLPSFSLDFTTASLDSRITFARVTDTMHPATYTASDGSIAYASNDQARFDHDPISLVCKGLLVEESRTNAITYSEDFTNVAWSKLKCTISPNSTIAPNGFSNADKVVLSLGESVSELYQAKALGAVTVTLSSYVKKAEYEYANFAMFLGGNGVFFNVNLVSGLEVGSGVYGIGYTLLSKFIHPVADGWLHIVLTASIPSGTVNFRVGSPYVVSGTGDGTSGIYIWGAQLEVGGFPTSYIPTTTTALTRNADVATMTGTNFSSWYNAGAGTWAIYANARSGNVLLTAGEFTLSADTTSLKKYAATYTTDQTASSLAIDKGAFQKISYYKQALTAAELTAITH